MNVEIYTKAVKLAYPDSSFTVTQDDSDYRVKQLDDDEPFVDAVIDAKVKELENAEPMRVMREERNAKLIITDWWASSDVTITQEQKDYRKALRDLPETASPKLAEDGQLTGVTWPEKPE